MSLAAAISALKHDAGMWDQVAQTTRRAGQDAADLALGEPALSWASVPTGLLSTYEEIQDKVVRLLDEATDVYSDLSIALDKVAVAYEVNDENAATVLKGVWDVRD